MNNPIKMLRDLKADIEHNSTMDISNIEGYAEEIDLIIKALDDKIDGITLEDNENCEDCQCKRFADDYM